ncbi:receptor-interacting serine threonine- kinase 2-like [Pelobates cultripes]|uniref:Receptor-interacting serine threonine- kinase 2-like n=1 Tax=Pelobates cultripes TaxID=61616 RepID=A0AAD1THD4_PELCU|nr:receptor-interacting serine threonine- kinase 2-like [Pelobates cultripes]
MFNNNPVVRFGRKCQLVQTSSDIALRLSYGPNGSYAFFKHLTSAGLDERQRQEILEHVECMRQIKSERLAPIIGTYQNGNTLGILLDWMSNGSLHALIYQRDLYPVLPPFVCVQILADVAEGLCHLHSLSPQFVHQALKPSNILLDGKYRAKVSDFGMESLRYLTSNEINQQCRVYLSPERLQGYEPSTADDVYSFGMTCYGMFRRQPPFHGEEKEYPLKLETGITRGLRPQPGMDILLKATNMSCAQRAGLVELVNCCWHQNPKMRPSTADCLGFLRKIQQTFSVEEMEQSVNSLQKEMAEKAFQSPVQEYDISFLDFYCSMVSGKTVQRNRTQSTPEKSHRGVIQFKSQRSASLPCPNSVQSVQTSSPSLPVASHMNGTSLPCENARHHNKFNLTRGCSHHEPRSGGPSRPPNHVQNRNSTKTLIEIRESLVQDMTEGKLNRLLDILRSSQIFSRDEYEVINSKITLTNKVRQFLDICCEKGEEASRTVLQSLSV